LNVSAEAWRPASASITLDLDATDDPTHGHQQLTLFHGYYGQYNTFR